MLRRCLWLICLLLWPIAASAEPGACGASAGQTFTLAPTTGLCKAGLASAVTGGTGPWSWYCQGTVSDPTQLCSALKEGYYFLNWTDGATGPVTATTPTFTVPDAATAARMVPHFKLWTYVISIHGYADMLDFKGGASHSVVLKGDHSVVAWGGSGGQGGVPAGTRARAIDAGVYHTLIVREDGTVGGFGVWSHPVAVPDDPQTTDVPVAIPGGVQAVAVAGGYAHSIALTPSGEVRGWGDNYYGQITIPEEAKSGVVAIAAGHHHNLALKEDGTVIGWGRFGEGQVPPPTAPSRVPPQVAGQKIIAIAAKAYHSVALTADGKVIAWGANELGQGNVPASALTGVVAIAAGGHHTVALKKDGTVLAWGDNKYNESTVPSFVKGASAIAAGTYHTYALLGKSPQGLALYAWGQNQSQQCEVPGNAYLPVAHGNAYCNPAYPPHGSDSTCTVASTEPGYGVSAFVVNGQSMTVTTDTVVIKSVKDFTSVTVGFSQGAQVMTFDVPALYKSTTVPINSFTASGQGAIIGYAITMTPTKPTVGWSATPPTTFNVGTPGPHTLYAWTKDSAGNVSTAVTRTVNVDNVPPTVSAFNVTSPVNHYYTSIDLVTATDGPSGSGVTAYMVKDSQTPPDINTIGWAARPPGSFTFAESGTKTLYAWARDLAGNISAAKTATVVVDTTPPRVDTFTLKTPSGSKNVAVTALTGSDNTGVTGYMLTENATVPAFTDPRWTSAKPTGYTFTTDGDKLLYAWVKDTAGNVSGPATAMVTIDATPPVVTSFTVPAAQKSRTVPITTFAASDLNSSVTAYAITSTNVAPAAASTTWKPTQPTSFTVAAPGVVTLYAWAKDAVGNISAPATAVVNIDTIPPVVTFSAKNPCNTLTVPLTISATDASAINGYMVKDTSATPLATADGWSATPPASYTLAAPGSKTLYAWARDAMGNVSATKSALVSIDTTPPTLTTFSAKTPCGAQVPITAFTAADNMGVGGYLITENGNVPDAANPGWKATKPLTYAATTSGDKTLYAWVMDRAGNVSQPKTASVTVDAQLPVVTAFDAPPLTRSLTIPINAFAADDNQAVNGYMITTTATAPAATLLSWRPLAPTSFAVASSGIKTLYAWARDTAGNVSVARTATVNVDLTPPVVTFTIKTPANNLTVPINLAATDSGGVAGYMVKTTATAPLASAEGWTDAAPASYTFPAPGPKILYAWAKDRVGNVSVVRSASVNVDTTAPVVTNFTVRPAVKDFVIPIVSFTGSDNTKVTGYLVTNTPGAPDATDPAWKATRPLNFTATSLGPTTLYGWVKDGAGNVSASKSAVAVVDQEAPAVTAFAVPALAKMMIPITTFTGSDNDQVAGYMITTTATPPLATALTWRSTAPTSFAVASTGEKTLYAWVKDRVGNVSAASTATVTIDNVLPVISRFTVATPSNSLTVTITGLTASDNNAVTGYLVKNTSTPPLATAAGWSAVPPDSYTFPSAGPKVLYAWARDAAGNVSIVRSATVNIVLPAP